MKCSLCRVTIGTKPHAMRRNPRGALPVCFACCGPVERARLLYPRRVRVDVVEPKEGV